MAPKSEFSAVYKVSFQSAVIQNIWKYFRWDIYIYIYACLTKNVYWYTILNSGISLLSVLTSMPMLLEHLTVLITENLMLNFLHSLSSIFLVGCFVSEIIQEYYYCSIWFHLSNWPLAWQEEGCGPMVQPLLLVSPPVVSSERSWVWVSLTLGFRFILKKKKVTS